MSWLARIVEERHGAIAIAVVEGEVDSANVSELADSIHSLLTNRSEALVVDLSRTTYIDSAGINLLFGLNTDMAQRQQRLHVVVATTSPIARMLAITGLDATVPTHATRKAALTAAG